MKNRLRLCLPLLLSLFTLLFANAGAHAAIRNQASAGYVDAKGAGVSLKSNTVRAMQPETIRYFTNANYTTPAMATTYGRALFIEATAPACDADPTRIDTITLNIASKKTGDTQSYLADETDVDSAVFHITSKVWTAESRNMGDVSASNGALDVMADDTLMATIESCGSKTAVASILVDPVGIVFDSKTNQPLPGATVTLIDVTGDGNGGRPGEAAIVFDTDGETRVPSTFVTDSDGHYHFPLVAPSLYRLQVVAPTNYTFPSKLAAGLLPEGREINLYGSYGGNFIVSATSGVVTIDVPVDAVPGTLYLEKNASRAIAEIGDFVDYTVIVHNTAEQALVGVKVDDVLPAGFALVPGTVRLDNAKAADPKAGVATALQFDIGAVPAAGSVTLRYRVRIGAGALQGDGINRASATSAAPLVLASVVAAAKVKVEAGVFTEKGVILGKVFADCNANGVQDADEPGVPGVRIYLEDGAFARTDIDGKYSFLETRPRTHVAKVDQSTLPQGATLSVLSQRNLGDAASRFVDAKDGELAKADFALAGCSEALRREIATRRAVIKADTKAADATVQKAPAVKAAKVDVAQLDNTLGFVDLKDGAVLASSQATVRVKGALGVRFTLLVNGEAVADTHIGQRNKVAERQLESWDYVGVALRAGKNTLELRQNDSFGNARGSSRVDVIVPGALAKLRVELPQSKVAADGRATAAVIVRLEDAQGVPVLQRTPVTLDANLGQWLQADLDPREPGLQAFVEGGQAEFALRAPNEAGEAKLLASSGTVKTEQLLSFVPDLRPLVAAGVIEGAVSLNNIRGNVSNPNRSFDAFEDQLRSVSGNIGNTEAELGARAAVFMKGKVAGDTLLTMSYDSSKEKEEKLFRDVDPLGFYPTTGDDAERGFEAQSTSRGYLRADRNKSWLLFGDMTPPGATPARNLGAYNRSLTGLRHHYEANGLTVDSFASRDSTRQMVEEVAANGTSGPYLTGSAVMVLNSERVEIIVRDRNQTGIVLSNKAQIRYVDYDIEPLSGRIIFRAPVASLDADLNPVSVRISYEVDQGAPQFWVAGSAAQYKLNKAVEVGGSYVSDRNPIAKSTLSSVNATVKPDDKTTIIVEAAQMNKELHDGNAVRVDATRNDGKLEARVYAVRTSEFFDNQSALLPKGRLEAGVRAGYKLTEQVRLDAELLRTEDLVTGAARDGVQIGAGYAFKNGVRVEAGVRHAQETAAEGTTLAQPDLTSVRAKVTSQIPGLPQASVSLEAEQDIKDSGRRMVALGGDYRLAGGSRLYGRHELISSLGSNYALNEGQERNATVFGIDSEYMKDGRAFSEYRARGSALGSKEAEAAMGLRNLWTIGQGVRASTSFERVRVLSGPAANESVAVTGAIDITRNPLWRGNARLELRHGEDSDAVLNTLGLAYKLSEEFTFLGKNTYAANRSRTTDSMRVNELLQSGVAYRAPGTLGVNALAKYEFKLESDNGPADLKRAVHAVSVAGNWQPTRETVFSGRYAGKLVRDSSNGLDTRGTAHLLAARVTHEIGRDWDVGAAAQVLFNGEGSGRQYGLGLEAGYQLQKNMWVSAGYNFLGFKERDLAGADATSKGVYVRLRMKFDERALEGMMNAFN